MIKFSITLRDSLDRRHDRAEVSKSFSLLDRRMDALVGPECRS